MLIDGEKWACEACVRGHRVSNCHHSDRQLMHINKKGRPVSQCPHCRGLRKSRSAHTKCECGDKPHAKTDCEKVVPGRVEQQGCCCSHGMTCTCSLKKDHLTRVPEIPPRSLNRSRSNTDTRKPRLSSTYSDPSLTVFANGHHKPVRRLNHAGQECGVPYKIPRPHSIHGQSVASRNSTDSLRIPEASEMEHSQALDSITSIPKEERLVRSEHGSPGMSPLSFDPFNQLPQLDLSYAAFNTSMTSSPIADDYGAQNYSNFEAFVAPNDEQAPLSAALSMPPFDWSAMDLPLESGNFSSEYSQAPSYASFDQGLRRPGLTPSSSGEVSEADEFITQNVSSPGMGERSPYITSPGEHGGYAYNLSSDSFAGVTQSSLLPGTSMENMPMESFFPTPSASSVDYADYTPGGKLDTDSFPRHGFSIHDAQKLSHVNGVRGDVSVDSSLRTAGPTSDPLWAAAYNEERNNFNSDALWINQ